MLFKVSLFESLSLKKYNLIDYFGLLASTYGFMIILSLVAERVDEIEKELQTRKL